MKVRLYGREIDRSDGVKNERRVKKSGEKETLSGEKETLSGEKGTKEVRVNFAGQKKPHHWYIFGCFKSSESVSLGITMTLSSSGSESAAPS